MRLKRPAQTPLAAYLLSLSPGELRAYALGILTGRYGAFDPTLQTLAAAWLADPAQTPETPIPLTPQ